MRRSAVQQMLQPQQHRINGTSATISGLPDNRYTHEGRRASVFRMANASSSPSTLPSTSMVSMWREWYLRRIDDALIFQFAVRTLKFQLNGKVHYTSLVCAAVAGKRQNENGEATKIKIFILELLTFLCTLCAQSHPRIQPFRTRFSLFRFPFLFVR